jgi:hypothetical protein
MRVTPRLVGTAGVMVAIVGLGGCSPALAGATGLAVGGAPAAARTGVWVEVSPNNIAPGFNLQVRADCSDNSNSATVYSKAFGTITVQPWNTLLLAQVTVPASIRPGRYDVTISCRTGSTATTSLTLVGSDPNPGPTHGPHTGGGFLVQHKSTMDSGVTASPWAPLALLRLGIGLLALIAAARLTIGVMRRRRRGRVAVVAGSTTVPMDRPRDSVH